MRKILIKTVTREQFVNITPQVQEMVLDLNWLNGILTLYCPHTTAAITINVVRDPTVANDFIYMLDKLVPYTEKYRHEGNPDAHIKSSVIGTSEQVFVDDGNLQLGQWQGIIFCEFDGPQTREIWLQLME